MKNVLRRVLCAAVAVMLCLSMTGCMALDNLKAEQAFWTSEGSVESFSWNGVTYQLLPQTDIGFSAPRTEGKTIAVTEKDVPVLLSYPMGWTMVMTDNEMLAINTDYDGEGATYYCRADEYDTVVAQLTSGDIDFNRCYYSWYDWEKETDDRYELTEAEYAAVQTVRNTVKPEELPAGAEMEFDYYAELNQLSENGLFEKYWLDACVVGDTYYVCEYDSDWNMTLYTVPEKHVDAFQSLLKKAIEAYEQEMEYLYGEDWADWEDEEIYL